MKIDDEVECQLGGRRCMVSSEAPVLFAKACEIFVLELTERAWSATRENKRRTLQRSDVCAAVARSDIYDFLIDIVPRDDSPPPQTVVDMSHHMDEGPLVVEEEVEVPRRRMRLDHIPQEHHHHHQLEDDDDYHSEKRDWQQRIAEHLFYSHPLAHRLTGPQGHLSNKRSRDDAHLAREDFILDDDQDDDDDDDDDDDQDDLIDPRSLLPEKPPPPTAISPPGDPKLLFIT